MALYKQGGVGDCGENESFRVAMVRLDLNHRCKLTMSHRFDYKVANFAGSTSRLTVDREK
jgi:hypothetical protein